LEDYIIKSFCPQIVELLYYLDLADMNTLIMKLYGLQVLVT